ncbi:UbiA prenyltransferase family-domain-containing protein [Cyathus striatus]|nr:UbiA prenyltransferase family-domain-containing protein [Cyathus striatus]
MPLVSYILREVDVFFSFSWRDWSVTIIPGTIFAVGAISGLPIPVIINNYLILIWWIMHFIYFFNLSNQITGVVEDGINKKDRPIPSGKVTLAGAKTRWMIVLASYLAISIYEPNVFLETIVWIFTTVFLSLTPGGHHWIGKNNIAITLGTWALLNASWKLFAPHNPESQLWVYGVAAWNGPMMNIQDLRDIEGDIACGRKTMSILFGDWETRLIISFVFTPLSLYFLHLAHIMDVAPWTITMMHGLIVYRVLQVRGSHYDHKTHMYPVTLAFLPVPHTSSPPAPFPPAPPPPLPISPGTGVRFPPFPFPSIVPPRLASDEWRNGPATRPRALPRRPSCHHPPSHQSIPLVLQVTSVVLGYKHPNERRPVIPSPPTSRLANDEHSFRDSNVTTTNRLVPPSPLSSSLPSPSPSPSLSLRSPSGPRLASDEGTRLFSPTSRKQRGTRSLLLADVSAYNDVDIMSPMQRQQVSHPTSPSPFIHYHSPTASWSPRRTRHIAQPTAATLTSLSLPRLVDATSTSSPLFPSTATFPTVPSTLRRRPRSSLHREDNDALSSNPLFPASQR